MYQTSTFSSQGLEFSWVTTAVAQKWPLPSFSYQVKWILFGVDEDDLAELNVVKWLRYDNNSDSQDGNHSKINPKKWKNIEPKKRGDKNYANALSLRITTSEKPCFATSFWQKPAKIG
jgi:hypothetical protein